VFDFSSNPGTTFESALPLIFEDSLIEYIKHLYITLNGFNMQIPWIYVVQNKELLDKESKYLDPNFDTEYAAK